MRRAFTVWLGNASERRDYNRASTSLAADTAVATIPCSVKVWKILAAAQAACLQPARAQADRRGKERSENDQARARSVKSSPRASPRDLRAELTETRELFRAKA